MWSLFLRSYSEMREKSIKKTIPQTSVLYPSCDKIYERIIQSTIRVYGKRMWDSARLGTLSKTELKNSLIQGPKAKLEFLEVGKME